LIINHKKSFIFFRPLKVAGTSIEAMLSSACDSDDFITGPDIQHLDQKDDTGRVFEKFVKLNNTDEATGLDRFHIHTPPDILYSDTKSNWEDYTKITAVRNPWDLCVSYWWWCISQSKAWRRKDIYPVKSDSRIDLIRKFRVFLFTLSKSSLDGIQRREGLDELSPTITWFSDKSKRYYTDDMDKFIRFEYLEDDCRDICKFVGIKFNGIPRFKTDQRKLNIHYSNYYDPVTIRAVGEKFKEIVEKFEYKFESDS